LLTELLAYLSPNGTFSICLFHENPEISNKTILDVLNVKICQAGFIKGAFHHGYFGIYFNLVYNGRTIKHVKNLKTLPIVLLICEKTFSSKAGGNATLCRVTLILSYLKDFSNFQKFSKFTKNVDSIYKNFREDEFWNFREDDFWDETLREIAKFFLTEYGPDYHT
jgi:hypothetical protein